MSDKSVVNDALQMRNGTGKTTALNLIQRLLTNQTLTYDDTIDMDDNLGAVSQVNYISLDN